MIVIVFFLGFTLILQLNLFMVLVNYFVVVVVVFFFLLTFFMYACV